MSDARVIELERENRVLRETLATHHMLHERWARQLRSLHHELGTPTGSVTADGSTVGALSALPPNHHNTTLEES